MAGALFSCRGGLVRSCFTERGRAGAMGCAARRAGAPALLPCFQLY